MTDGEDMTEAELCHFHLHRLRQQYERDTKPWIDRLVQLKQREVPIYAFPATGTLCSVCGELQFEVPGGASCINGHGGAPPMAYAQKELA